MMICVNANYIGTNQHLLFEPIAENFFWVNSVPTASWTWGFPGTSRMFEDVVHLLHQEILPFVPEPHRKATELIWNESIKNVPWKKILPSSIYGSRLKLFLKQIGNIYKIFYDSEYATIFEKYLVVLGQLCSTRIDVEKWKTYLKNEKSSTVRSTLKSFVPVRDDYALLPEYNYCKTSTGRAVMRNGPQILTLPSNYRDIIIPAKEGNIIIQLDFISLEPRVALYTAGKSIKSVDIYAHVLQEVFDGKVTRSQAKLATLCALYGASLKRLQQMMPNENVAQVVHRIKTFFGVLERVRILKSNIKNTSLFHNHFGRCLKLEDILADHVLFSRFVQSTAVDVSMLGFFQLLQSDELRDCELRPLFILHDALILEIPKNQVSMIREYCNRGVLINELGVFPLEVKMVE